MSNELDGKTVLLGLIGSPVGHSNSPKMYNYSFNKLGINYAYLAFDIKEQGVKSFLESMRVLQMRGANVTMPDKSAVAQQVDKLSPAARLIGAVNTIVNDDGILTGHNTDGEGFVKNLAANDVSVANKTVTLLGAGGAGTAITVQLALDGAKKITIFNMRDEFYKRAQGMAAKVMAEVPDCQIAVADLAEKQKLATSIAESEILINTTRVGMAPDLSGTNIEDTSLFRPELVVADTIYNPSETKMLADAKAAGCKAINGDGMLLWQGVAAFKLYTGQAMPIEEVAPLLGVNLKN